MPSGVLDVLWTAVFLVGIALALRGPIAWIFRSRAEKREAAPRPSPDTQNTQPPSNDAP